MTLQLQVSQRQTQQLLLSPQMAKSIKLLQLGRLDYIQALYAESAANPLLEVAADETSDSDCFNDELCIERNDAKRSHDVELWLPQKRGLCEELYEQLSHREISEPTRVACLFIVGNLDHRGYLTVDLPKLASDSDISLNVLKRALTIVQTLDPPGVGARSLKECLRIQLTLRGQEHSLAARIVDHHLMELARRSVSSLARKCNVSVEEIKSATTVIRSLTPSPAAAYEVEPIVFCSPDVYVSNARGRLQVRINDDGMPRLQIHPQYLTLSSQESLGIDGKQYVTEQVKNAHWLLRSIAQRTQTILSITESIFRFQHAFLEQGIPGLLPLTLKDVAEQVGVHESTVSRITSNKYVHTARGVFELKFFFSAGLKSSTGELAATSVKERIRLLIDKENPLNPLSDQAIARQLGEDDVTIARRTVAKYREALGIGSSTQRKQLTP